MLTVESLRAGYGHIEALKGVSLEVREGEVVALIGANGAGKTTLLMTLCGVPRARAGRVLFDGQDITHWPTHRIIRAGIAHVPEGRRIFPRLTVRENLLMGGIADRSADAARNRERIFAMFPRLAERLDQRGGTLSGGEQQMLAIARALMGRPRLLLLDEPSLGLAPLVVRQIFAVVRELNAEDGMTILLVEQNAHHALRLAHRGYVMVNGAIAMHNTGAALLADPEVRAAYLEGAAGGTAAQAGTP